MTHSFTSTLGCTTHLVCAPYVLRTVLGSGDRTVNKAATAPILFTIFIKPAATEEQDRGSTASVW